jgi:restriction system protein
MTADVQMQVAALKSLLTNRQNPTQSSIFSSLQYSEPLPSLTIPPEVERSLPQPVRSIYLSSVRPRAWWEKLIGYQTGHRRRLAEAEDFFRGDFLKWQLAEKARADQIATIQERYSEALAEHQKKHSERADEIEQLVNAYQSCNGDAVVSFFEIVLDSSKWPEEIDQEYRVAYEPGSRQLFLDYKLPGLLVIPEVEEYRWIKTRDAIDERHRKPAETKELYKEMVAAVALRTLHECFCADECQTVDVIVFSGYVNAIDPATGQPARPYLISIRVTRERFLELALDRVDTKACLRNLGAQVSAQPAELLPVKPIIEFDMVDKRFIGESDVISTLDSRPNLMDLTPPEFETLVANLFTRMGLETKQTRTHRDGGVDAIAFDMRPIFGGKVVIQAKRYSYTVGVSAVRDLYGTMMDAGANKGILITTSSYGPDAFDFCRDKPIELIEGSELLYHLEQVGVKARILFRTEQSAAG